jgi:serine/threonine-protein kinase HipA
MTAPLVVSVSGVRAGLLYPRNEGSFFELDDDYLGDPTRPILGQVFEDDPRRPHRTRQGVPPWFANLLPEGPLRRLIAERADVHEARSFFLLNHLGNDLPGAVSVHHEDASASDLAELREPEVAADQQLRFSLAGVQMKFSALREDRGLTIPTEGLGGDWIVKLPDLRFDGVPENEFSMMEFARLAGLDVPETLLLEISDIDGLPEEVADMPGRALAVRRFDRADHGRVHIEDFAQVLNLSPRHKYGKTNYDTIARIVSALGGDDDLYEFIRRLAFMIAIGNSDAHAKNWSLIYPNGRSARLAPAYDLVAVSYYEELDRRLSRRLGLKLAGIDDAEQIDYEVFKRFAQNIGVDETVVSSVVEAQVAAVHEAWAQASLHLSDTLNPELGKVIEQRLKSLPLFKSTASKQS